METRIVTELRSFFEATGHTQSALAKRSGVNEADISRLVSGKHKDIRSAKADALRKAMNEMLCEAPSYA